MLILRVFVVMIAMIMAPASFAQTNGPDYAAWDLLAGNVESTLEDRTPSEVYLTQQRANVSEYRQSFAAAQTQNASKIEALQKQIEALGPPPEEGLSEPDEISARRAELQKQLDTLNAARARATEAFTRADAIIVQFDKLLAEKNTDRLLTSGPLPINPAAWPDALGAIIGSFQEIGKSFTVAMNTPAQVNNAQEELPVILAYVLLGLFLILRSGRILRPILTYLTKYETEESKGFTSFAISLGHYSLMYLGSLLLLWAVERTGLYGFRVEAILDKVAIILLGIFALAWIGSRIFDPHNDESPMRSLPKTTMAQGRRIAWGLAIVLTLRIIYHVIAEEDGYSDQTLSVISFAIITYCSILLARLGQFMMRADGLLPQTQTVSLRKPLGQLSILVAAVAFIAALTGYTAAAEALLYPAIYTLVVIASLIVIFEAVRDFFALASTDAQAGRDGLMPVLVNSVIFLAAIPVVLLIWGMQVTELQEYWQQFIAGMNFGGVTISPTVFLIFVTVFSVGYFITRLIQRTLRTAILPKTKLDKGAQNAAISGFGYIGVFIAALVAITSAGLDLSSLAIVAGALSVGIGFGLQNIVSNFVSGIILLIERPISEGDWIEVGGQMGYVRDISVRSTRIETFDRTDVIVPNADLISGSVTNYTRGNTVGRIIVKVGVAYGSDTRKVEGILKEIIEAHPMVLLNPAPFVYFAGFGADSLDFEIRAILRDITGGIAVKNELHHQIAERFDAEGLEIPFMQRDIWIKNPEALAGTQKPENSAS
ncbi:MAG: DUF3772 domain-containing protein [Planktomarina sp.]